MQAASHGQEVEPVGSDGVEHLLAGERGVENGIRGGQLGVCVKKGVPYQIPDLHRPVDAGGNQRAVGDVQRRHRVAVGKGRDGVGRKTCTMRESDPPQQLGRLSC